MKKRLAAVAQVAEVRRQVPRMKRKKPKKGY